MKRRYTYLITLAYQRAGSQVFDVSWGTYQARRGQSRLQAMLEIKEHLIADRGWPANTTLLNFSLERDKL
jgi:hypothetical protein